MNPVPARAQHPARACHTATHARARPLTLPEPPSLHTGLAPARPASVFGAAAAELLFAASACGRVCQVVSMATHLGSDEQTVQGRRLTRGLWAGGGGGRHECRPCPHPELRLLPEKAALGRLLRVTGRRTALRSVTQQTACEVGLAHRGLMVLS